MYKIVHGEVALPASGYLIPVTQVLHGQHKYTYMHPQTSTDYLKYSYFPETMAQWNYSLPAHVVQAPSVHSLRETLGKVPLSSFKYWSQKLKGLDLGMYEFFLSQAFSSVPFYQAEHSLTQTIL